MPPKKAPEPVPHVPHVPPAPQHRTPTQLLADIAMAQATRVRPEPMCDVELTWNAKADTQIKVAYSHPDPAHVAQVTSELYDTLRAKYPRKENGGG